MVQVVVMRRDGSESVISVNGDITLMEALRDNGFDEVLALCGGCCSCATCHVYVESDDVTLRTTTSEDEDELLNSSDHRGPGSRLSCQVRLCGIESELKVRIAPED